MISDENSLPASIPEFGQVLPGVDYRLRPGAYAIITDSDDRIAIVRMPRGHFLPGGGIDAGESVERAVRREVREECGLLVTAVRPLCVADQLVYSKTEAKHLRKRSHFFRCRVSDQRVPPLESDHQLLWRSFTQAIAILDYASQRWALERALDR